MPSWDDQFDFDDIDDNKKKGKVSNNKITDKKVSKNNDDQFFDLDDEISNNKKKQVKSILPTINSRNSAKSKNSIQSPSNNKTNPFANKSFGSKQIQKDEYELYDEQIQEQVNDKKGTNKNISKQTSNSSNNKNTIQNNKLRTQKSTNKLAKNKSQISEQQYNEQFMQQQVEPYHQSIQNNNSYKNIKTSDKTNNLDKKYHTQNNNTKNNQNKNLNNNKSNNNLKNTVKQEPDQYQEEFQNQQYQDDDFQEQVKSPVKNLKKTNQIKSQNKPPQKAGLSLKLAQQPKKPQNKVLVKNNNLTSAQNNKKQPQTRSQSVAPPKPPVQQKKNIKQTVVSNKNIHKIQSLSVNKGLKRSASKQSVRSNGQKSVKGSRISQRNQSQYFPNKHIDMVEKSFPHDQQKLNILSQIQINKINEKMRSMIRKFNQQLNDLINKNMLLLKNKSLDKQQSIQQKIRQLQIQKKSGQTAIQVMQKDFDKLQGRQGQLKQEEYQLILQKQIQEKKNLIKQTTKQITLLKRQVDNRGKKLSVKQTEQKNAQNIHHLKTILIQSKKDQQKGDQRIQKLISTQQELQTKGSDLDYKLEQLISQAKQKGVNIQNTDQIQKKYEQLKTKLQNIKNFNKKSQGLNNTKIDILNHQNQQIRITIRNINSQISNLYGSIDHSQSQAIKLIQKAKQKQGINPLFAESLDKLAKQIEQSRVNNDYYDARSQIKSRRSDSTKNGKNKNHNQQLGQKSMPLRVTQSQNRIVQTQQQSVVKPKFLKKKPGQQPRLDIQNKSQVNQRVWNNQEEKNNDKNKTPKNDQNKRSVQDISIKNQPKQKVQVVQQDKKDKSKPFMLKKNKPNQPKQQPIQEKVIQKHQKSPATFISQKLNQEITIPKDVSLKIQQPKKQQPVNINLGPRMMKFGRKKAQENTSQNNIVLNDNPKIQKQIISQKKDQYKPPQITLNKNQGLKLQIAEPVKQPQQQKQNQIFVPKRFNLRNKGQKKDDSYTPSVQKDNSYVSSVNSNTQKSQPVQPAKQQVKEQYKPKFDFKNEQFKIKQQAPIKKQPQKPIEQPQIKPRFNLRLRDRMNKNTQQQQTYGSNIGNSLNKNLNGELGIQIDPKKNQPKIQTKINQPKNQFIIKKQTALTNNDKPAVNNPYNPYAPKVQQTTNVQPKKVQIVKQNPQPKIQNVTPVIPVNNPYAAKVLSGQNQGGLGEGPKRQRGPLKKNKISANIPKQSFNIYAQADDLTNQVKQIGGTKTANQNVYESVTTNKVATNNNKKEQLNINDMLGIKKQVKKNDFDDLLGDVGGINSKNKKKNNDFFSDLQF